MYISIWIIWLIVAILYICGSMSLLKDLAKWKAYVQDLECRLAKIEDIMRKLEDGRREN